MGRAVLPAVAALALSVIASGSAATPAAAGPAGTLPVERVLIISLPSATWAGVAAAETPRLQRLLAGSAVASASLRVFHRCTPPAEGYTTLGAGALAAGNRKVARIARVEAGDGAIVSPAVPVLAALAAEDRRGAEVGALGDALARAGVARAVVANADTGIGPDAAAWRREAVLALAGSDGRVPAGEVSATLLVRDSGAPFGVRLDHQAVEAAFRSVWHGRTVVLVEASDLARAEAATRYRSPAERRKLTADTLATTDAIVGSLLEGVDRRRHAVLVVSPSTPCPDPHLGVAALAAPGVEPGLLRSASTRRSGLVTLSDIAPTVLHLMGVSRPGSMEGRPFEVGRRGRVSLGQLVEEDTESRFRDRMVAPATRALVGAEVILAVAAALSLAWTGRPAWVRRGVAFAALWILAALMLAWLPATFDLTTPGSWWGLVAGGGLVLAATTTGLIRRPLSRVALLLGLLFGLLVLDVVTGWGLQLSAVFGYSPTVGGRYAGFGNLAFAQLATAAGLLAAIAAHRLGGRRGAWAGMGVLAGTVVVDGLPAWGSDVGGVLAALPGFAVVASGLLGVHLSAVWVAATAAALILTMAGFAGLDLLRPPAERTHLGRLLERVGEEGLDPLRDVISRKRAVAWDLSLPAARRWLPLVPVGLAFLAYLAVGPRDTLRRLAARVPQLGPAVAGVLVIAGLGFALNDSGVAIPAMMLAVLIPTLVHLTCSMVAPAPSRHGLRPGRGDQAGVKSRVCHGFSRQPREGGGEAGVGDDGAGYSPSGP